jgi:hypothetical protein
MLAGRIDGMVDGRPLNLIAERQNLVLTVESWRTLIAIGRSSKSLIQPLREFLNGTDIRLYVRLSWVGVLRVHPNPSFLVRMLLPMA